MANIYTWAKAFNAPINGKRITWKTGLKAKVFVHQEKNLSRVLFNTLKFEDPMPVSEAETTSII